MCLYIHLTLVPYLKAAGERRPSRRSTRSSLCGKSVSSPTCSFAGPNATSARRDRDKIALFCNVDRRAVIEERDKEFSIYEVPVSLVENGLDELIVEKLGLSAGKLDLDDWRELVQSLRNPRHGDHHRRGRQIHRAPRRLQKSIYEALDHAGIAHKTQIRIQRIEAEEVESEGPERLLSGYDGMLVPGGFGERGIDGKIEAIRFARERQIPFFGICLGMQCAVIEFARNVIGLAEAHSTEFDKDTPPSGGVHAGRAAGGGRQGGHDAAGGSAGRARSGHASGHGLRHPDHLERHRHRYEFNNEYRSQFVAHGFKVAGTSPDGSLVEVVELADHPWFVAVQFHPEFKIEADQAHPLFAGFIAAAIEKHHPKGKQPAAGQQPSAGQPAPANPVGQRKG